LPVQANDASIARVRAERKCGELLRDMEKAKPPGDNQYKKQLRSIDTTEPKTLAEMGLTKDQSSKWQKLADIPEEVFEQVIDSGRPYLRCARRDNREAYQVV